MSKLYPANAPGRLHAHSEQTLSHSSSSRSAKRWTFTSKGRTGIFATGVACLPSPQVRARWGLPGIRKKVHFRACGTGSHTDPADSGWERPEPGSILVHRPRTARGRGRAAATRRAEAREVPPPHGSRLIRVRGTYNTGGSQAHPTPTAVPLHAAASSDPYSAPAAAQPQPQPPPAQGAPPPPRTPSPMLQREGRDGHHSMF